MLLLGNIFFCEVEKCEIFFFVFFIKCCIFFFVGFFFKVVFMLGVMILVKLFILFFCDLFLFIEDFDIVELELDSILGIVSMMYL